ncbi:MAG: sugar transferase, partial [bacterium]
MTTTTMIKNIKPGSRPLAVRRFQNNLPAHFSRRLRMGKRALDIAGAIAGLILFSPIMLLAAILIKATSRGPILFKQIRLGYG